MINIDKNKFHSLNYNKIDFFLKTSIGNPNKSVIWTTPFPNRIIETLLYFFIINYTLQLDCIEDCIIKNENIEKIINILYLKYEDLHNI